MKTLDDILAALQASLDQPVQPPVPVRVSSIDDILTALQQQIEGVGGSGDAPVLPSRHDMIGMLSDRKILVRKHHSVRDAWSFLCPQVHCQQWTTGFQTVEACRTGWYKHSAQWHDPHYAGVWPDDIACGEAQQPVCFPGHSKEEDVLLDLIRTLDAVDRGGRPLTFGDCEACPRDPKQTQHKALSGRTCVWQVICPKCDARQGVECDRSTNKLARVRWGKDNQASAHEERFEAVKAADEARRAAGDMTLQAAWLPAPAPTARKRKPTADMPVTLVVDAPSNHNDMWRSLLWEYNRIGRLNWTNGGNRALISFPSMQLATWSAGFIAEFYGVSSDLIRVDAAPAERPAARSAFAWRVWYDAEQVLATADESTPDEHVAWAAGVLCTQRSASLLPKKLTVDSFVNIAHGGTLGYGCSMTWDCDRSGWRLHRMGTPWKLVKKLRWGQVIQAIQGRTSPVLRKLRAEMEAAEAEVALFPHGSVEFNRAMSWSLDVAMEAWLAVRPADLAPFAVLTSAEAGVA